MDYEEKRESSFDKENGGAVTPGMVNDMAHDRRVSIVTKEGSVVNASGHRDQLNRQYGLLSICGLALTIDNAWVALGGSLTVSIRKRSLLPTLESTVSCLLTQPSQRWTSRCPLRALGRLHILPFRGCQYRRTCVLCSLSWRRLPLGLHHTRRKMGPDTGLLHRLAQLFRVDLRPGVDSVNPCERRCPVLRNFPSRVRP